VVGGSAGAVEGFQELVRSLPADLPAALFFVLHIPMDYESMLPHILSRAGHIPAKHPLDGERIRHGHIYVAPPDRHVTLEDSVIRVRRGPRENRHRPAIDPLFRTAARVYGPRVIGIIMSGQLDDGAAGLRVIRSRGGLAIVQDPADATHSQMPQCALQYGGADHVLPGREIGPCLIKTVNKCAGGAMTKPESNAQQPDDAEANRTAASPEESEGLPSTFSCPDCHGTLWELRNGDLTRFRCRVGHAFTINSLAEEQAQAVENALWAAMRALEEKSALSRRLAESTFSKGVSSRLLEQAETDHDHAELIRKILFEDNHSKTA
jgi:two-component system, chemotaxis family, protein-glutamate methylesterase/glutaminase